MAKRDEKGFIAPDTKIDFEETVFVYLDDLRKSGVTNMFGAGPYVVREFGVNSSEARRLVVKWMETFSVRHPE